MRGSEYTLSLDNLPHFLTKKIMATTEDEGRALPKVSSDLGVHATFDLEGFYLYGHKLPSDIRICVKDQAQSHGFGTLPSYQCILMALKNQDGARKVYELHLASCALETGHMLALCHHFEGLTRLTSLDLSRNKLCSNDAELLSDALRDNDTITVVNVAHNELGRGGCGGDPWTEGIRELGKVTGTMTRLKSFNVGFNYLSAEGIDALAQELRGNTILQILNVAGNDLLREGYYQLSQTMVGVVALCNTLLTLEQLTTLDVSWNNLGEDIMPAGWEFDLDRNGLVYRVDTEEEQECFDWPPPGSECTAAMMFEETLRQMPTLKHLNMRQNGLSGSSTFVQPFNNLDTFLDDGTHCTHCESMCRGDGMWMATPCDRCRQTL